MKAQGTVSLPEKNHTNCWISKIDAIKVTAVAHTFHSSIQKAEEACEFEANLVYLKPWQIPQWDPRLKTKQDKTKQHA